MYFISSLYLRSTFRSWLFLILIDRYQLAVYWVKLINWNWQSSNFGYHAQKPVWLSVWLLIIVDNTFHIIFNALAIVLFYKNH